MRHKLKSARKAGLLFFHPLNPLCASHTHTHTHTNMRINLSYVYYHAALMLLLVLFCKSRLINKPRLSHALTHIHTHIHIRRHICIYLTGLGLAAMQNRPSELNIKIVKAAVYLNLLRFAIYTGRELIVRLSVMTQTQAHTCTQICK